jgi:hypothetical protein
VEVLIWFEVQHLGTVVDLAILTIPLDLAIKP